MKVEFENTKIKGHLEYVLENIKDFVYKNDVVQCTIADSNFDKIKNLIPRIEKVENIEIKNRHKSLLDVKFKDDKTIFCDIANITSNKGIAVKKR